MFVNRSGHDKTMSALNWSYYLTITTRTHTSSELCVFTLVYEMDADKAWFTKFCIPNSSRVQHIEQWHNYDWGWSHKETRARRANNDNVFMFLALRSCCSFPTYLI